MPSISLPIAHPLSGSSDEIGATARLERVAARLLGARWARLSLLGDVAGSSSSGMMDGMAERATDGETPATLADSAVHVLRDVTVASGGPVCVPAIAATNGACNAAIEEALALLGWGSMAGVPVRSRDGRPSGAILVGDVVRRDWEPDQLRALEELASVVVVDGCVGVEHDAVAIEEELRAAKEAAEEARAVAEAASQAKTDFLSRMSHELRTPLNSVIGFANLLRTNRGDRLDERELSYLDRIVTNGRHLLTIVGDLLDLSRVEAGKMPVSMAMVPLAPLVRTTAAAFEADLAGRPVELVLELPQEMERLETDPTRLQQVLINLVGNAIKFTDGGTITVRVVTDPDTSKPIRLEVQDTGIGIPLHRQAAIFRAFEQAERGTDSIHGGTGLGLAISRSLCQLLGFRLSVHSAPGEGATFTVDFDPDGDSGSSAEDETDYDG